jgi:hypothetical protein
MDSQSVLALLALVAAFSLVAAPVTMADWGEQATFHTEPVERAEIREDTPILQYDSLSIPAQNAVRNAIESPDGFHIVYGWEDAPDEFFYSDYARPGQGEYAVTYQDQHYYLRTMAGGGFPFVYWLYELPFVIYGLMLGWVGYGLLRGRGDVALSTAAVGLGFGFHLLGPEFDFPLLAPMEFVTFGAISMAVVGAVLVFDGRRVFDETASN